MGFRARAAADCIGLTYMYVFVHTHAHVYRKRERVVPIYSRHATGARAPSGSILAAPAPQMCSRNGREKAHEREPPPELLPACRRFDASRRGITLPKGLRRAMTADAEVASTMIVNDSAECSLCTLGPPPDMILRLPPPPIPTFLVHSSDYYPGVGASDGLPFFEHFNNSPCKHSCEWRAEGVQYVEMPQQGTVFDDTWLLVLISSCIGVIFIGIVLAALLIKCKFNRSNKNSTLSTSTASSGMQTTTTSGVGPCVNTKSLVRLQNEAVLYPCGQQDSLQDSRVMWAKLTPRGTTRHYLEEHTYETIGNVCNGQLPLPPPPPQPPAYVSTAGMTLAAAHHKRSYSESPTEHTYTEPPAPSPIMTRPKDEKAFDNTAFVDYEEPLSMRNEYYQLEDVLEPCDPIFSVQGLYGMPIRGGGVGNVGNCVSVGGTLRPRVSSPTRIEHPNLPPLNLQPLRKHPSRKNSLNQHAADCTLLRGSMTSSTYIPTI